MPRPSLHDTAPADLTDLSLLALFRLAKAKHHRISGEDLHGAGIPKASLQALVDRALVETKPVTHKTAAERDRAAALGKSRHVYQLTDAGLQWTTHLVAHTRLHTSARQA